MRQWIRYTVQPAAKATPASHPSPVSGRPTPSPGLPPRTAAEPTAMRCHACPARACSHGEWQASLDALLRMGDDADSADPSVRGHRLVRARAACLAWAPCVAVVCCLWPCDMRVAGEQLCRRHAACPLLAHSAAVPACSCCTMWHSHSS